MKRWKGAAALALLLSLALSGCGQGSAAGQPNADEPAPSNGESAPVQTEAEGLESAFIEGAALDEVELEDEAVALASGPAAISTLLLPQASGTLVQKNSKATIDYSNTKDGYVMVNFTASTAQRLKVQVSGPTTSQSPYTYNLTAGKWETLPLSDGNGNYTVKVFEHTGQGNKYAAVLSASFSVALTDEFAPYLRPNQYVDYAGATATVAKAAELVSGISDPLKQVEAIYDYVVKTLSYDKTKAASVQSGYLPVLDSVLAAKKGICFDYAALMAGMLRSQGIPCKLVVGYAGTQYHAWINVYTAESGWIEGAIYFNGSAWERMDPTFASSANGSASIMKYIGDGSNYTAQRLY